MTVETCPAPTILKGPAFTKRVEAVFRPEGLGFVDPDWADPEGAGNALVGEVITRHYAGEATFYEVEMAVGGRLLVADAAAAARPGERVAVTPRPGGPPPRLFAAVEK